MMPPRPWWPWDGLDRRSAWAAGLTGLVLGLGLCGLLLYLTTATYGATTAAPLDPNVPANSEAVARGAGRIREIRSVLRDIYGLASNQTYLDSAMLISTDGGVTFMKIVSFRSGLGSTDSLLSILSPTVFQDRIVLQSNYAMPATTVPPIANAVYANMFPKAMALVSGSATTNILIVLDSINTGLISEDRNGVYLVSLLNPMAEFPFLTLATTFVTPGDNAVTTARGVATVSFALEAPDDTTFRRQYFRIIVRDSTGTLTKNSFSFVVYGRQ